MTDASITPTAWPALHFAEWRETCAALHLWSQIVGKYRLAYTPWINHSWHATLYVTPRGLTTGPVSDHDRFITLDFDFCDHRLVALADGGASAGFALESMSVADFFARTKEIIAAVGGSPQIHGFPNEVVDSIPFADDTQMRSYDADAVERFHRALLRIHRVFELSSQFVRREGEPCPPLLGGFRYGGDALLGTEGSLASRRNAQRARYRDPRGV